MPEYRRTYGPGGTFFLTWVPHQRSPVFAKTENIDQLRQILRAVRRERPFEIIAAVILPDHLHFLWTLPEGDSDFSWRVGRIKALFTKSVRRPSPTGVGWALPTSATEVGSAHPTPSRRKHRESDIWQRRFWKHTIRDEADLRHHIDYIHYNPVKHGLVNCPHAWPHSSFRHWVNAGSYDLNWCCVCDGTRINTPYPGELVPRAGE